MKLPLAVLIALTLATMAQGAAQTPAPVPAPPSTSAPAAATAPAQVVTSRPCQFDPHAPPAVGPACLLARKDFDTLPAGPVYWQLDTFPDVAAATAAGAAETRSVVVEDYGKVWLFTIAGKDWRPRGSSTHVATVGPLPVASAPHYAAEYVHSHFASGTTAPVHKHSGPEAFYALSGDTCVEMPDGVHRGTGPGNALVMPAGDPMLLMATGTTPREAFALVLHDSSQPATTRVSTWTPEGLCGPAAAH